MGLALDGVLRSFSDDLLNTVSLDGMQTVGFLPCRRIVTLLWNTWLSHMGKFMGYTE